MSVAQSTDERALLAFKASISSNPSGVLGAWTPTNGIVNATNNVCRWSGVSCLSRQHPGRVTALELMSSNLTGVISPSIANLSFLHTLNLSGNNLHGSIPSELGMFHHLQVISLGGNSLTGKIPASLTNCARLTHVELQRNGLHGEIPSNFSYCRELRVFNVSVNSLSGGIPPSFGALLKLEFLGLHRSNLTGGIPPSLGNISSLLAFDASENYNLGGDIPDALGRLTKLNYLRLASAGLNGTIPPSLFNISSLRTLDLGNNDLSGVLPPDVGITLPRVQFLSLYNCQIKGRIPSSIGNATELRLIQLHYNDLQGTVPPAIGKLKNLEVLNLQFNQLEEIWNKDWGLMAALGNCSKLLALSLSSNRFHGVLPPSLVNLTIGIQQILMYGNRISGTVSPAIGKFSNLRALALADNALSGTIPDTIGRLHSMIGLDVSGNDISGEIPPMLVANLTQLALLDLSQNELQGSIPESFGVMRNIAVLDLSYNQFTRMIPKQGNRLTGTIPQSLSSLKGLQYLDMSQNNLSGSIPDFLSTLQFLQFLNLSYNQFDGSVPTRGVFNDSRNFSVAGNKVCGGVSELRLTKCAGSDHSVKRFHKSRTILIVSITMGFFVALVLITCSFVICARKSLKRPHVQSNETAQVENLMEQHLRLSYDELQRATDGFSEANLIGVGSFGSVYRGTLDHENQEVAIKVLNLLQHGAERSFLAECEALRSIRHRNLIKRLGQVVTSSWGGVSFFHTLNMAQRLSIALDVAKALDYLHHNGEMPIIHCDLKPSNVLIDNDMVAHVGDFGLSRFVQGANNSSLQQSSSTGGIKGTIGYIPPEYGMSSDISVEGDIYSYGVLLLEMFTAKRPTDPLFERGQSILSYVTTAYPERVMEVADQTLLQQEQAEMDEGSLEECLLLVFWVALRCSEEPPRARMATRDAIRTLTAVSEINDESMGTILLVAALMGTGYTTHAASNQSQSSSSLSALLVTDEQALLSIKGLIISDPHRLPTSNLTGTISPFLANLTFLHILNLSYNSFSGNVPWELGFLSRLLYLDLCHNSLQGMIPPSLAQASKLRVLQLEYNRFVGVLPVDIGFTLPNLQILLLSQCQLSRRIPHSIVNASQLKYVQLDDNELEGTVPLDVGNNLKNLEVITACSSVDHQGNDFKALVYEFMPNGDLDK
ncbi:hypothetical protein PR202_gb24330 [Eleusine coracana subsp. coracana]|uniref:non-specific serine/threonine protein kinase n=1 Tax=Eleusine coracana subsp. coracana TaxID=191504 RepID=A0AAV5FLD4_ELECO|nr:hypothetical protein PR202_gb24330 [Eleusine coracana subsp. coracana]